MDHANTTTVGIRELKTRLGTYLRLVRQGSRLIVTDRGRPVAQLCPLDRDAVDLEALLHEMTLVGEATRVSAEALTRFEPISIRGKPLSETVSDDREDRV